jgi:RNA polymerase sigma-70 factor (ECF subfamily)
MLDKYGVPSSVPVGERDLKTLYLEHELRLSEMVRRHIGQRLAARIHPEDVLHDAFLRAEKRWASRPADPADHYCWLYGIVRDEMIDQIRKAMAGKRSLDREVPIPEESRAEVVLGLIQSRTSPSGKASRLEEIELARQAMNELRDMDAGDFEIVTMRIFDDLGFKQIGEIVGASENTVTKRYHRALHKLLLLVCRIQNAASKRSEP